MDDRSTPMAPGSASASDNLTTFADSTVADEQERTAAGPTVGGVGTAEKVNIAVKLTTRMRLLTGFLFDMPE